MNRKRHPRGEVRKKGFNLPKAIQFLRDANFVALIEDRSTGLTKWTVEVKPKTFKLINNAQESLIKQQEEMWTLQYEINRLKEKVSDQAQEYSNLLRRYNEQARKLATFQKDTSRSQKSALNVLVERGTNLVLPALPGGLAGVEKK